MEEIRLIEEPLYNECHYCHNEADYYTNHTDLNICKYCVEEYVRQEVLTPIGRH